MQERFVARDRATGVWRPVMLPGTPEEVVADLRRRAPGYAPRWQRLHDDDPGIVLASLFADQLEQVRERLDRLPAKAFVEAMRIAGVTPVPALPAATLVELELAPAAPRAIPLPAGFQLSAEPADGSDELVTFELERALVAYPGKVAEVFAVSRNVAIEHGPANDAGDSLFKGLRSGGPGDALWLGLSGEITPQHPLSLAVAFASVTGTPTPQSSGGLVPPPPVPQPRVVWEAFNGASWVLLPVLLDETQGLATGGVLELDVPDRFLPARPAPLPAGPTRRWLRARVISGRFAEPPRFRFVRLNMARANAVRTFRNEVLEIPRSPLGIPPRGDEPVRRVRKTPVRPGSMVVEVDDGRGPRRWREVQSLADWGAADEVFTLDASAGELHFGDGRHGARLPIGFRNVVAVSYQVGGGRAGRIDADGIGGLRSSAPFVLGAKNPLPATGGTNAEPRESTLRRGPALIRARGRAVALADYEALALLAPGAAVARAKAVSGLYPGRVGVPTPGIVGLFVVPMESTVAPPIPDADALRAVARHLARELAPAGIEIVAAAPRFHLVRIEATAVIDVGLDPGATTRELIERLDRWLDPLAGGAMGDGWPFGAPIEHPALVRRMLEVVGVKAIERIGVVIDGTRSPGCRLHSISAYGLPWPDAHTITIVSASQRRA
jgi:predicted phage baseplate assembly protein